MLKFAKTNSGKTTFTGFDGRFEAIGTAAAPFAQSLKTDKF